MESWTFVEYDNIVSSFLSSCRLDKQGHLIRSNLKHRWALLLELGNKCRGPVSKSLGDGLYELCAEIESKEVRLMYIFMSDRTICFVHAFFKKTKKTSPNDMEIGRKNKKLAEEERSKIDDLNFTY